MNKIAFIFSGQGAQQIGMGQDFVDESETCRNLLKKADKITGGKITDICFNGTQEELNKTINTQPCLYTMEMMAYISLVEKGYLPHGVAGFSLGEYAALGAAGCFDFSTGLDLVIKRGQLMDEAAKNNPGAMAAVLGLTDEEVIEGCAQVENAWPVNFNCEKQIVISGTAKGLEEAGEILAEKGGKIKPLAVSGGFHSPLMDQAAKSFGEYIEGVVIKHPEKQIFLNVDADAHAGNMRSFMKAQINSPVLWKNTIENMIAKKYDTFIEIGPGKTLAGFMKRINKDVKTLSVSDVESLNKTVEELGGARI